MELHVVWDTKGEGRLVGVFATAERAAEAAAINPAYFRVHAASLDAVNPAVVRWAYTPAERGRLKDLR
ncbi:MAG TPA: hypothetical protein VEJ18_04230 [Planctomycetota bacterium]|nr:hypothetical protein [Planctomycetota bacterium]